jgi:zinc protease
MTIHRLRAAVTGAVLLLLSLPMAAQQAAPPAPPAASTPIPFDSAVRRGTLPNGLSYYVRENHRPEKRVALRLAVKAGSLYEQPDQQGLAHLIEHMAFNGSAHFKPGELVAYFESTGARLGPHVNAYTSFDETVYMLELPTDPPDILAHGLTALADFAGGLTLDPGEVEKEKGVVIEEWRGGLGASSRIRDRQLPLLYAGSRYAERLPIGKPEIIRAAPPERLRAFYDTWYRPERMAVVAVGDVDAARLEQQIRDAFGGVSDRAPAAAEPSHAVPLDAGPASGVTTDPEVTSSSVEVIRRRPHETEDRVGDYRRALVENMVSRMINARLGEIGRRPDAKFLGAGVGGGTLGPEVDSFSIGASVPDGGITDGLNAIATEASRVREFGFTDAELDRTKRALLAFYERAYNERDKTESGSYVREYVSHFLDGEPSPGIAYEYQLVQALLPGISTDEVSTMAKRLLDDQSRVVLAVSPDKSGIAIPAASDLTRVLGEAERAPVTAWADATLDRGLLEAIPDPAPVTARATLDDIGVTKVTFANGVEAWLKPTTFKNDQVLFSLEAPGGASLATPDDFEDASLATSYVMLGGVGGLKPTDLQKLLAGRLANASPHIGLSTHGISGQATPAELETALQLLYQEFTAPSDDADAMALIRRQLSAAVANRDTNPIQVFREKVGQVNTSGHYTSKPLTADTVGRLDPGTMAAFYRARFSNAADFRFTMVGAFDLDDVIPLLARYIGSLPSTGTASSTFKDVGIHFPETVQRAEIVKGREPRSQAAIAFFADPPPDFKDDESLSAAMTVLNTRLRDMLREDLGQTYTVSVRRSQPLPQRGAGYVSIQFGAAPENLHAMIDRTLAEIEKLKRDGPPADLVDGAKQSARRGYETAVKQNGFWLGRLEAARMYREDPAEILQDGDKIAAVTPESVQRMFREFFPSDRYTVVTLVPAPAQPSPR